MSRLRANIKPKDGQNQIEVGEVVVTVLGWDKQRGHIELLVELPKHIKIGGNWHSANREKKEEQPA
jgi:hypothetical protein